MLSKYMTPKHIWTLIFTKEQDSYEFPEPQTKDFMLNLKSFAQRTGILA